MSGSVGPQKLADVAEMAQIAAVVERMTGKPIDVSAETIALWREQQAARDRAAREASLRDHREARLAAELGPKWRERTLDAFVVSDGNRDAYDRALEIVAGGFREGVAFWSPTPGNGKTHLAVGICAEAIGRGVDATFITVESLLARIRDGFDGDDREMSELRVIVRHAKVPVLALDDIGTEELTPFAARVMFSLVNKRYELGLPVILTANANTSRLLTDRWCGSSNANVREVAAKIISRLVALTSQSWVQVSGPDMRMRKRSVR